MSAGDLTNADYIGLTECSTPACGNAEVWDIGLLRLRICQRCAGHAAVNQSTPLRPTTWQSPTLEAQRLERWQQR